MALHLKFFNFSLSWLKSLTVSHIMLIDQTLLYRMDLAWNSLLCTSYIHPGFFNCICLFFSVTCLFFCSAPQGVWVCFLSNIRNYMEIEMQFNLISPKAAASAVLVVNFACAYSGIRQVREKVNAGFGYDNLQIRTSIDVKIWMCWKHCSSF